MRRTALVTTSTWIYGEKLHAEVLARLIDAFVGGDRTPHVRSFVDHIMRLARVMNLTSDWVIDTKSKRGEGLVSWAKVRTLHRIELASCLAAAFRTEHACAGRGRGAVVDELFRQMSRSPYERLLDLYEELDDHERTWVATIVYSANTALRIIGGEGAREKLVANQGDPETEQLRRELVPIVEQLDEALFQLFFKSKLLGSLTERLALFG